MVIMERKCPECSFVYDGPSCLNCGFTDTVQQPAGKFCPACRSEITQGKRFCSSCGFDIEAGTEKVIHSHPVVPPLQKERPVPARSSSYTPLIVLIIILTGVLIGLTGFILVRDKITFNPVKPVSVSAFVENTPLPTPVSPTEKPEVFSQEKIPSSKITVSASDIRKKEKVTDNYGPNLVLDGLCDTAWNSEGSDGKWIKLSFAQTVKLCKIGIIPGYDKVRNDSYGDRWYINNRVKSGTLVFSDGGREKIAFDNKMREMQYFELDPPVNTSFVKLEIDTVYRGTRFDDTCISEVEVYQLVKE